MRWYYPLFACAAVLIVLGVALAQHFWPLFFLGPVFWLVMGNSLRCPRCRRGITDTGKGYVAPWLPTPKTCVDVVGEKTTFGHSSGHFVRKPTSGRAAKGRFAPWRLAVQRTFVATL